MPIHFVLVLSIPIHLSAIDTNPLYHNNWGVAARIVTCGGSSQVLNFEEYPQRGSFEFWLLVLLVASALSRWFFSVVIASKLYSQRGSFELLALWALLYYLGVRVFFRTVSVYWQHFDYLFHVTYNICDSFRLLTTHNCQFEVTTNLLNFLMWFISWCNP